MLQIQAVTHPRWPQKRNDECCSSILGWGAGEGVSDFRDRLVCWHGCTLTHLLKWQRACLKITQHCNSGLCTVGENGNLNIHICLLKKQAFLRNFQLSSFQLSYVCVGGCVYIYIYMFYIYMYVHVYTQIYCLLSSKYRLF